MSELPGTIVVLSGPTAVGKSTVGKAILERMPDAMRVVTATTRKARPNEVNDVDYHFLTLEEFFVGICREEFLEYAPVHGECYGTPKASVEEALAEGKVVLMIIDVDGGHQIRDLEMGALLIFLKPPSRAALRERIAKRGTESEAEVIKRMNRVDRELSESEDYDHQIVNDDLETCISQCVEAIQAHRAKAGK